MAMISGKNVGSHKRFRCESRRPEPLGQGRCCFSFLSFWGVGTSGPVPGRWRMVFSIVLIWSVRETIDNLSIEGDFVTRAVTDIYGAYCRGAHDCSPMGANVDKRETHFLLRICCA